MALTRFHYGQAYRTCFLEGLAAGLGEAEAGGGWRRGGGHERAGALGAAGVGGGGGVGAGGVGGGRRRDERGRGGARGGRAGVQVVQRPGHVDAEVEPQRHLGLPPSALHPLLSAQQTNQPTATHHFKSSRAELSLLLSDCTGR